MWKSRSAWERVEKLWHLGQKIVPIEHFFVTRKINSCSLRSTNFTSIFVIAINGRHFALKVFNRKICSDYTGWSNLNVAMQTEKWPSTVIKKHSPVYNLHV